MTLRPSPELSTHRGPRPGPSAPADAAGLGDTAGRVGTADAADAAELADDADLLTPGAQVGPADSALAHRLGGVGVWAVALATVGIGLLHLLPPTRALDPLSRTISEYALMPTGWIFDAAVIVLALGSAAVLAGLITRELTSWRSWGAIMTSVWCVGLIGLVVFPKQGFGPDSTIAGRVHWTWTLIAFFSLPIAAALLCGHRRVAGPEGRWPRWAVRLSVVAAGWFAVLTGQTVLGATTTIEASRFVGLVERALSATEMATVVILALWLRSESRVTPGHGRRARAVGSAPGPGPDL